MGSAAIRPFLPPLQLSGLRLLSGPGPSAAPLSPLRAQLHYPHLPSPRSVPPSPAFNKLSKFVGAPPEPMPWIWSCHKCHARYPLGATRRCLNDGHYFCGGVTVNKITGKVKKHRACASEFDYTSWEEYGKWRRRGNRYQIGDDSKQHCEHTCEFPSACHWKSSLLPEKVANFDFLDPQCSSQEDDVTPLKKTGLYIDKIVESAEKRASQLTTLLSTIEEERNFASVPGYIPSPTSVAPKLPEVPSLHGLDLSFPVLETSDFEKHVDSPRSIPTTIDPDDMSLTDMPPELSSSSTTTEDDGIKIAERLSDHQKPSSPPVSPKSKSNSNAISFNFSVDDHHEPQAFQPNDDDVSPLLGHNNAWDWTAEDIGIALGSPNKPACEDTWNERMRDETEKAWELELGLLERRVSF